MRATASWRKASSAPSASMTPNSPRPRSLGTKRSRLIEDRHRPALTEQCLPGAVGAEFDAVHASWRESLRRLSRNVRNRFQVWSTGFSRRSAAMVSRFRMDRVAANQRGHRLKPELRAFSTGNRKLRSGCETDSPSIPGRRRRPAAILLLGAPIRSGRYYLAGFSSCLSCSWR